MNLRTDKLAKVKVPGLDAILMGLALAAALANAAPQEARADSPFLQEQFGHRPARRAHLEPRFIDPDDAIAFYPVPIRMLPGNQQARQHGEDPSYLAAYGQPSHNRRNEDWGNDPSVRVFQEAAGSPFLSEWGGDSRQRRLPSSPEWQDGQLRRSNNIANRPSSSYYDGFGQNGIQNWNGNTVAGMNGADGLNGRDGMNGLNGGDGMNGGMNRRNGMNGRDGINGMNGRDSINGAYLQSGIKDNAPADPAFRKPDKFADNPDVDADGVRHFANGKHFDLSKMSLEAAVASTNASTMVPQKRPNPKNANAIANGGNPLSTPPINRAGNGGGNPFTRPYDAPPNGLGRPDGLPRPRQMASFQENFPQQPDWDQGQPRRRRNQDWRTQDWHKQMDADYFRPDGRFPNRRQWTD